MADAAELAREIVQISDMLRDAADPVVRVVLVRELNKRLLLYRWLTGQSLVN